jgi:ABC-2 type transport system ATP-binding protein
MPDSVIETRSLRKEFGDNVAVADLSLEIGRGEVFGFLGPNGAGKTTSLKLLLGLIEPSAGDGSVLGAPLGRRAARERIGFLPEHFRFHDCLTGRELLRVHGRLFGLRGAALESRIDRLLAEWTSPTRPIASSRPTAKAWCSARARTGADQRARHRVPRRADLRARPARAAARAQPHRRAARARYDRVLNSHLLGEVEATCDRVVFVKQGRVVHELSLADRPAQIEIELRIDRTDASTLEGLRAFGGAPTVHDGSCGWPSPPSRPCPRSRAGS